jgi:DNA-binding PadR family transcriptional regulator
MDHELLLLGLLRLESMHGYQLNAFLDKRLNYISDLKESSAYYLLKKLEADNYVSKRIERQGNRPRRYVYELTGDGERRFQELLRDNLSDAHKPYFNADIGFLFMDALPPDELQASLERKRAGLRDLLKTIGDYAAEHPSTSPARLVLERNAAHLQVDLEWLDRILGELQHENIVAGDLMSCIDEPEGTDE